MSGFNNQSTTNHLNFANSGHNSSRLPLRDERPRQSPVYTDFSKFNNSPAILARGTRTVGPTSVTIMLEALGLRTSLSIQLVLKNEYGFDLDNQPSVYPFNKYLEIAEYLRSHFMTHKSPSDGYEELGYRITNVYFQGVTGQVLKMMGKVMGPQRGSKQFLRTISNQLPWGVHELVEVGPNHMTYHKRLVGGPPPLMLGILRASLEVTGAKVLHSSFSVLSEEEDDILYDVEWK